MENTLSKEQAAELYNKSAANLLLTFVSYYKYSFNFKGEDDSITVEVLYGGGSAYIYRFSVDTGEFPAPSNKNTKHGWH